jgi:uroporphyrinogen decarboxylase
MSNLLHRERFIAALSHQEADRVPMTLGSPSCSIHRDAQQRLLDYLGFSPHHGPVIIDNILQIVEPDPQLLQRFDVDVLWLLPLEPPVEWGAGGEAYVDEFGRRFILGGGFYNQVAGPLQKGTPEELSNYQFPRLSGERVRGLPEKAAHLYEQGFGLGVDGPWGIYEISSSLRGTEQYLMDMLLNPIYSEEIAERVLEEHHIPFYTLLMQATAPYTQMVVISDDLGGQQGLIFSPRLFRKIFKPRLKRLIEHIHALADVRVYMHSDGAIFDLIPDLIEIGVEGLNPVQYTARGMELAGLKNTYGKDLGFFGGTLENDTLSFRDPEHIRRVVAENIAILAPGGGFLFAPIHNFSQEVPPENIIAFWDAGLEFGRYPLGSPQDIA